MTGPTPTNDDIRALWNEYKRLNSAETALWDSEEHQQLLGQGIYSVAWQQAHQATEAAYALYQTASRRLGGVPFGAR